jgi:hypothetical protein
MTAADLQALLPGVAARSQEYMAAYFDPAPSDSPAVGIGPGDLHNRDPRNLPLILSGGRTLGNGVLAWSEDGRPQFVLLQAAPWNFEGTNQPPLKRTQRRLSYALSRLVANQGVALRTPLLENLLSPLPAGASTPRWLTGLYVDRPEEWDDPYRVFRW